MRITLGVFFSVLFAVTKATRLVNAKQVRMCVERTCFEVMKHFLITINLKIELETHQMNMCNDWGRQEKTWIFFLLAPKYLCQGA